MSELQIFNNAEFGSIRTLMINDEPYFVGKDVAEILGYTNPQKAIRDHIKKTRGQVHCRIYEMITKLI